MSWRGGSIPELDGYQLLERFRRSHDPYLIQLLLDLCKLWQVQVCDVDGHVQVSCGRRGR